MSWIGICFVNSHYYRMQNWLYGCWWTRNFWSIYAVSWLNVGLQWAVWSFLKICNEFWHAIIWTTWRKKILKYGTFIPIFIIWTIYAIYDYCYQNIFPCTLENAFILGVNGFIIQWLIVLLCLKHLFLFWLSMLLQSQSHYLACSSLWFDTGQGRDF